MRIVSASKGLFSAGVCWRIADFLAKLGWRPSAATTDGVLFPQVRNLKKGKNNARLGIDWRVPSASVLVKLKEAEDLWAEASP